MNTFN